MHMKHNYASDLRPQLIVVKYGGSAMEGGHSDPVLAEVAHMWKSGVTVVVVHGGAPEIDRALAERGIVTERIDGQRVTNAETLGVTEAVLCGTINKRVVRDLFALGVRAVGISGQDGATLVARRVPSSGGLDLGFVGAVGATDPTLLRALLSSGFLPVVAPLAMSTGAVDALNVNADTAAAAIAIALCADAFVEVTNVARVLRDPDDPASGIDRFSVAEATEFAASPACRQSMKPKLLAAAEAVTGGAKATYICKARPFTIREALAGNATVVA
jgi:acetylglutamate kinase